MSTPSNVFELIDRMIAGLAEDKRSQRQVIGIRKWVGNKAVGTLEWATGVGKTRAATVAIQLCRRDVAERRVIIAVPRVYLKTQWERGLEALGLLEHTEVVVINSLIKRPRIECSLLILDEIHRYAAKTFAKVFDVVKSEFVLGLTAMLKRTDGKQQILKEKCPIVDIITMKEALREGYVSEFQEYNIGVEMTPPDRETYRELKKNYDYMLGRFNSDFAAMRKCASGMEPFVYGHGDFARYSYPPAVSYARELGWRGNSPAQAHQIFQENKTKPRRERIDPWGNESHPHAPKKYFIFGLLGLRYGRLIRQFINTYPAKEAVAEELIRSFDKKTIVFGEVISTIEVLKGKLGDLVVTYHSKMKAKEKELSLLRFTDDRDVRAILTARALDEGADFPSVELGVTTSRSSSETQYLQRLGRTVRLHLFEDGARKRAIFANVYVKGTIEVPALRKAQKSVAGMQRWVDTVSQLLVIERERIAA